MMIMSCHAARQTCLSNSYGKGRSYSLVLLCIGGFWNKRNNEVNDDKIFDRIHSIKIKGLSLFEYEKLQAEKSELQTKEV
jgi:hypothetical protein